MDASRPYSAADLGVTRIGVMAKGLDLGDSSTELRLRRFDAGVVSVMGPRLVDFGPNGEDDMVLLALYMRLRKRSKRRRPVRWIRVWR